MVKEPTTPPHLSNQDAVNDATAELLAAYALDALPADQEAIVVAKLAESPAARALLREYQQVVHLIPYAVPRSTPSPLVRDAVLRAVHDRRPRRRRARMHIWQFAVAAVMLLGLLAWNVGLQTGVGRPAGGETRDRVARLLSTPGLVAYDMVAEPTVPQATGRIYVTPDEKQAAMAVTGLPPLPSDRDYQLWFNLDAQTAVSITTFSVDARGTAMIVLPVPPANRPYVSCRITEEPHGGSAKPTGSGLLWAQWPSTETYSP